jgi:cobalt/nickel transport protein
VRRTTWFILGGLLVALFLAGVVSNFASGSPDGLDAASRKGCTFSENDEITGGDCMARNAKDHELADSPLADYGLSGIGNSFVSTAIAGVTGVLVTFAVAGGIFWLVRRRGSGASDSAESTASTGGSAGSSGRD